MRRTGGRLAGAASALALALICAPMPLAAQSTSDLRLPGTGAPPPNPRAAGPVDPDNPVVRSSQQPRPAPTPTPTPSAAATPAPSAAATRSPAPVRAAPPRTAATPAPRASTAPTLPSPAPQPTPAASSALPGGLPDFTPAQETTPATPVPEISAPALVPPAAESGVTLPDWWPMAAGGAAALLALLAGLVWWRRRADRTPEIEFEAPEPVSKAPPAPKPLDEAPANRIPDPDFKPAPAQAPAPAPATAGDDHLAITLEAGRLVASLMATTLSYRLTVTNRSREALSALAIEGDMVSAHASLPPEQQMASGENRLELRHALVSLAPGESAEFTGDLRLPLAQITPIRAGDAAYFVPLARLRVEAASAARGNFVQVQTFVIGEHGDAPGAGLRPFRLDLGPRTYARIGQRAVS